jgi:acid stress chaperone HdeB
MEMVMLRLASWTGTCIFLATMSPAGAQVMLDVSKLSCEQYATYKVKNPKLIAIWINGFQHGKRGDTPLDTEKPHADMDKVLDFCLANPDTLVMEAVEKVVGGAG